VPVVIDVDGDDPGTALFAGLDRVRHHVDLGIDRIGAPDDDHVRLGHLARIGTGEPAGAGDISGPGKRGADRGIHLRVALGVPQPVDAVAHDEAHCAGIIIGPNRFASPLALGVEHGFGRDVERIVPGNALEFARGLRPLAAQWIEEAIGMVDALGIARHLGADHPIRVGIVLGATNAANPVGSQ